MATAHDVAAYILREKGEMSTWKLQKLVYYSQAWHLVWDERPLFDEAVEAWANGPVVRALYARHRRFYSVSSWDRYGNAGALTKSEKQTVDSVLKFYGDKSGHWLSELTHQEAPWVEARRGLERGERGDREITHAAMAEYYSSI